MGGGGGGDGGGRWDGDGRIAIFIVLCGVFIVAALIVASIVFNADIGIVTLTVVVVVFRKRRKRRRVRSGSRSGVWCGKGGRRRRWHGWHGGRRR